MASEYQTGYDDGEGGCGPIWGYGRISELQVHRNASVLRLPTSCPGFEAPYMFFLFHPIFSNNCKVKVKVKQPNYRPWQALRVPGDWGSQSLRQSAHKCGKNVSPKHRPPLPSGNIPGTHFCYRLSRPQGYNAAGKIMWIKNSTDNIGNRSRDLPVCSAVSQPLRHRVPKQL
jgi:hypothetical protein